ncbi:conjugal transfer protein MobC [Pedobacter jeongneungensis]|uniref:conjugal transfer protein MobC n=1 Tax=Pedobacter jeongneungensis TaxID=947309 RepID=UPI0004689F6A|nr:conjugal transfer protein MobC [Pedobacter jeongneungensis]
MNTGEDAQGLRKIMDFTRLMSLTLLCLHVYIYGFAAFRDWGLSTDITDRLMLNFSAMELFHQSLLTKLVALLFLAISLIGVKGKKSESLKLKPILIKMGAGLVIYFLSGSCFYFGLTPRMFVCLYVFFLGTGYLSMLQSGTLLSRLILDSLQKDIFNNLSETFPQEERLLENEYSINLPARYRLKDKVRDSWINIINPFRGLLVSGTPGAGKSYFVIRHIIDQHIKKGFSIFLYDFKFDDLSKIVYNKLLAYRAGYAVQPSFYLINFDDLSRTHRCNPLDPHSMEDITDATEASRTIMLGLNRDWIKKQGDFFVESPINFLTAIIWYLKKYQNGKHCTLPHAIELMQVHYDQLFAILEQQEEIRVLINPFILAYQNDASAQLEGQIASAKIGLARLASPQLYYVLNGNDFTLDVNNPDEPKVVCMGNNPQKLQVYGAVLSLYISRMIKLVNRKGMLKSSLIFDEFPTIYFNNMDSLIATARSNKVATTLAVQDFSQLKKDYGADQSNVITGIVGNIISGQVTGDTAKKLSENFGKIMQDRQSMSINSNDTSISKSTQLDFAIPAAKIASLSSGEFVGFVADNPEEKIKLKMFHCEIQNDQDGIALEEAAYVDIPVVAKVSEQDVEENYKKIKSEVSGIVFRELGKITAKVEGGKEVKQSRNARTKTNNKSKIVKKGIST